MNMEMQEQTQSRQSRKRFIEIEEVSFKTTWSRAAIYALGDPKSEMHDPSWPLPVRLGRRKVAWVESEIDDWLDAKIAEARAVVSSEPGANNSRPKATQ
jgi:prophage regulatory protein